MLSWCWILSQTCHPRNNHEPSLVSWIIKKIKSFHFMPKTSSLKLLRHCLWLHFEPFHIYVELLQVIYLGGTHLIFCPQFNEFCSRCSGCGAHERAEVRHALLFKLPTNRARPWNDNLYHLIRACVSWHSSFIVILFMLLDCFTIYFF